MIIGIYSLKETASYFIIIQFSLTVKFANDELMSAFSKKPSSVLFLILISVL